MNDYLASYRKVFGGHRLAQPLKTECFNAFELCQPGNGRINNALVTFGPEGIAIQGDMVPGKNGVVSRCRYNAGWFSGKLSPDYLASKFLHVTWCNSHAHEWLVDIIKNEFMDEAEDDLAGLRSLVHMLDCGDLTQDDFFNEMGRLCPSMDIYDYCEAGQGYPVRDHAILIAIQERFADLYWPHVASQSDATLDR